MAITAQDVREFALELRRKPIGIDVIILKLQAAADELQKAEFGCINTEHYDLQDPRSVESLAKNISDVICRGILARVADELAPELRWQFFALIVCGLFGFITYQQDLKLAVELIDEILSFVEDAEKKLAARSASPTTH